MNIQVPDAYRAQFYLRRLTKELDGLYDSVSLHSHVFVELQSVINSIGTALSNELDRLLLPMIAYEIAISKAAGGIVGPTPYSRYESFFANDATWTIQAKSLLPRYSYLESLLSITIKNSVSAFRIAILALVTDIEELYTVFAIRRENKIVSIDFLGESDRHMDGQRVLLFIFDSGDRIVFKPTSVSAYMAFNSFIEWLESQHPNDQYIPKCVDKSTHGWVQYIPFLFCNNIEDVKHYYHRSGVLLSIAEALNYYDGHYDNLIAMGSFPVIVDLETLFQNHSLSNDPNHPNVLSTMLVQAAPSEESRLGYSAAFMSRPTTQVHAQLAYPIHDRTDDLEVRYRGVKRDDSTNLPRTDFGPITIHNYVDEFISGYITGYNHITNKLQKGYERTQWWNLVQKAKSRVVVRPTGYYAYLMCLIGQPEGLLHQDSAKAIILSNLLQTGIHWPIEVEDLLNNDVPYFYQEMDKPHLYSWKGECYPDIFPQSSLNYLESSLAARSPAKREEAVQLLKIHLPSAQK